MNKPDNVVLEGVRILYPNFAGAAKTYNQEGNRNFVAVVNQDQADYLAANGWNVKRSKPDEDGDYYLFIKVAVSYDKVAPAVILVTSENRTMLTEETVNVVDGLEFESVDIILAPYVWERQGETGIKAYLRKMYGVVLEDDLDKKYGVTPY